MAAVVSACGTAGPAEPGAGGVKVWALQDPVLNPIEQKSIDFFKSGGGNASLETFGNDPYKQKLRVAIGSPNAPDVFFNWGGGNLKEYVDAGKIADLTPVLDQNSALKSAFLPSVLDGAKIDGKYYGIPMRGMQPVLLFFNKEVFAAAGAQPPKTWDDLLALVDTFKAKGIQPISLAGSQAWTELMWIEYILDRIGGPEVFRNIRDGKGQGWKDPAVTEALTKLKELIDRGGFGTNFASVGYDVGGASTILAQGKAAMHLMGSWEYVNQLGQSPDFVKKGSLGWVAFPSIPGGKGDPGNVVGNASNYYSVTSGSSQVEAAKKFVSTALHEDSYVQALIDAGDVPAVVGVESKLAKAANSEYTTWIYGQVKEAKSFQLSWDQDLPAEKATAMLTQLQEFFLGKVSPQQFVDAVAAR
ncbi:carbohydrate ABC transporter substrate-binding protein (CUT1 family) [Saccharothrix variisporea]|uniref:Carbohydrate ABC transporter substrate-binding protein (CUT1 family) n=1 Tax=Saccharothrix variisporea TaxID=543527 RepID=A0A495X3E0_9PSEU|nr:carbohydrate ABC transporter substrate-binding protein (CUT1 family) [Saccharothrix variisporea]